MLSLSTVLDIYYKDSNTQKLKPNRSSVVHTPFEPMSYALIFISHINSTPYPTDIVNSLLDNGFIVIYFTDKLPTAAIVHKNLIYIVSPWRYFTINTIRNVNVFSCVAGFGEDGKKYASQYYNEFRVPMITKETDIKNIKKIEAKLQEKVSILFDTIYKCADRGLGDILMTTPIIKALKERFNATITYAIRKEGKCLLEHNPHIDKIITDYSELDKFRFTYHLPLMRETEDYKIVRNQQDRIDFMSELFNVKLKDSDKKPLLYLTENELEWSKLQIPEKKGEINIGFHIESISPKRRWDTKYLRTLIEMLHSGKYSFNIHLFGNNLLMSDCKKMPGYVVNYVGKTSLRQLCALVYRCDLIVTGDSIVSHIAAAFDKPCITMYTSIPAEWRCKYYKNTVPIQGKCECGPCLDWQFVSHEDWKKCKEHEDKNEILECVESITPHKVQYEIYKMVRKFRLGR